MLPKIIVSGGRERNLVLSSVSVSESQIMGFEGGDGKVDDLRHWINFGVNVVTSSPEISLVIWDADRLSDECQAVLLKPLEETSEKVKLFLIVTNENGLLPTITSRCVVVDFAVSTERTMKYWKKAAECFSKGAACSLSWVDELDPSEMEEVLEEIIEKLKKGLESGVSKSRLKVLKLAIGCLSQIKYTNVNAKLAFGNFLIEAHSLVRV